MEVRLNSRNTWVAGVVTVATALFGAVSTAGATTTSSPALFNRTTLSYSTTLTTAQEAARYQVMVLQSTDASEVPALHAANPKLKILMNSSALYSRATDPSGLATCTGYSSDSSDPTWFLKDQHGNRIVTSGESLMDMGNAGYQQACVAHVVALAKQDGFDGVMLDGFSAHTASVAPSGTTIAQYPTDTAWDAAMQSFLNYAGQTIQADGLIVTASLSGTSLSLWQQWAAPLTGSALDGWTDGGQGTAQQVPYWPSKLSEVAWSEANNKLTILDSYNRTDAGNAYGLASMLLVANGNTSYGTDNENSGETWYPEYTQAQQLGAPLGAYTHLSNGDYERVFANGIVLVNPTTGTTPAVSLSGTYTNGSTNVTSVSLAPTTGTILMNAPNAASPSASPALFNEMSFAYNSKLTYAQEGARYQIIVLTAADASKVAALHAANPKLKILMYSMAMYSDSADPNGGDTCGQYASENAKNPSWFLLDQNGSRMAVSGKYLMDMGNSGYQQACVAHAVANAKADGFNGILFDGMNPSWSGFVPSGSTVVKYPTSADWDAAVQSFLNYAGKTVQASGLLAFGNIGSGNSTTWDQWIAPLNGAMQQGFTDGGQGLAQQVPFFSEKLANDAWDEAHDKYTIEDSYNTTEAGNVFGLASMLLVANGYSSWSTTNSDNAGSVETWYPEYSDAQQLGAATGAYTVLSNGVYERKFKNGIVVVNPTAKAVSAFSLGGTYHGSTTGATSSVSLPATSGLILLPGS